MRKRVLYVYIENPTQNFYINYICFFSPVGVGKCKPFAETTFEEAM
jgi:hypothetical protein